MRPFEGKPGRSRETVATAIAIGAGLVVAAGVLAWRIYRAGRKGGEQAHERLLARFEEDVVERLRADQRLAGQPIEVAALATGLVELSGAVATAPDADLAVALARRAAGVRTVLNRLDVLEEMDRVETARRQDAGPGTARGETHWLGIGVGMGRRRQSRQTDPARRDDRADIVTGELGVERVVQHPSKPLDGVPDGTRGGAPASHSVPDDYGTSGDTSHRRPGSGQPLPGDQGDGSIPQGGEQTGG